MAERPFLGKGLPDAERDALIRSGVFDGDLFRAVRSKDWRRKYSPVEVARMRMLETQEIGSGWSYRGNLWDFYNFLRNRALDEYWDRQFRTGQNLTDPLGAAGYGIGLATGADPHRSSDVGATLGSVIGAAASGPRFSPPEPTYQRNPPAQTVGGRSVVEPPNPTRFVVAPVPPASTVKSEPPPASARASSGQPLPSQRADQRPASPTPGSRDIDNKVQGASSPGSSESTVPTSPRTGEADPLGAKSPSSAGASQTAEQKTGDAPPRKPRRFNVKDLLPPKTSATKTEPKQGSGGSSAGAKPAASTKSEGTKADAPVKSRDRSPSPRDVEKGTIEAIDRDVPILPTGSQVVSRGENFSTIANKLEALRKAAPNSPNLKPIDSLQRDVLEDNVWQLMDRQASAGRPELKDRYTRLYNLAEKRAKRGDPGLKDELDEFMKSGRLGARKPDSAVLVDEGTGLNIVLTDPTIRQDPVAFMVHEFKALCYQEGMRALFGNNPSIKVESWEHNPRLGIHREAQGPRKLPRY